MTTAMDVLTQILSHCNVVLTLTREEWLAGAIKAQDEKLLLRKFDHPWIEDSLRVEYDRWHVWE